MQLNPNYPGWYQFALFANAYNKGEYREALDAARRINTPGYFLTHAIKTAAFGQLGQHEDAQNSLRELLALRPNFASTARQDYAKWFEPEMVEHLINGLRKAGLEIAGVQSSAPAKPAARTGL